MRKTINDFLTSEEQKRVLGEDGVARRLPREIYSNAEFHQLEYRDWLDRTWLMVGRCHEIPNPGDAIPVPGHPIFLIRDSELNIRGFYNSCRHRGHELISESCNKKSAIVCPYHHWAYELNGRLRSATHFAGYGQHSHPQLDPDKYGLHAVRTATWQNWILINIDGNAPDIDKFVAPLANLYQDVDFSQTKHFATVRRHPLAVNWKTAMENNIEPYHVPMVHPDTAGGHPFSNHRIINDGPLVGCAVDIEDSAYTNRSEQKDNKHLDSSGRFVLRVPNLYLAAHAPDKLVDSLILPDRQDPKKCWISHACYNTSGTEVSRQETQVWSDIQQQVLDEDVAVLQGVARGFLAPVMDDGGVISPAWEACVSGFYREMLESMSSAAD